MSNDIIQCDCNLFAEFPEVAHFFISYLDQIHQQGVTIELGNFFVWGVHQCNSTRVGCWENGNKELHFL